MKNKGNERDTFAAWMRDQLTRRGYDLGLRGGGRNRFATDAGISPSTVGRLLRGEGATDTGSLARIAETLDVPLTEVLVRAGVLSADDIATYARRHGHRDVSQPLTPEQAADELGFTDPTRRALYLATVETLRKPDDGGEQRAEH